jgi:hypothetical protein
LPGGYSFFAERLCAVYSELYNRGQEIPLEQYLESKMSNGHGEKYKGCSAILVTDVITTARSSLEAHTRATLRGVPVLGNPHRPHVRSWSCTCCVGVYRGSCPGSDSGGIVFPPRNLRRDDKSRDDPGGRAALQYLGPSIGLPASWRTGGLAIPQSFDQAARVLEGRRPCNTSVLRSVCPRPGGPAASQ